MEMTRVLVVDDHPMLRGGILSLLNRQPDMHVVGEADNGPHAIELAEQLHPDIVVMDINLNGAIDVKSTEIIKQRWPDTHVVAFSMHNEVQVIRRMLNAGVSAYLTKSAPHDELIKAIRSVMRGEVYYDREVLGVMADSLTNGSDEKDQDVNLSVRESEVLYFVSKEFTNQEMADRMDISLRTVETHKRNLVKKLRVKNVVGLVRYAMENGHLFAR
jgi:two-component system, NarL family, response regulator NreC